jgi:hypothetical protein
MFEMNVYVYVCMRAHIYSNMHYNQQPTTILILSMSDGVGLLFVFVLSMFYVRSTSTTFLCGLWFVGVKHFPKKEKKDRREKHQKNQKLSSRTDTTSTSAQYLYLYEGFKIKKR